MRVRMEVRSERSISIASASKPAFVIIPTILSAFFRLLSPTTIFIS